MGVASKLEAEVKALEEQMRALENWKVPPHANDE